MGGDPLVCRWCGHKLSSREDQVCPGCNELVGELADNALAHFGEVSDLIFGRERIKRVPGRDMYGEKLG